jgi:hypothetical protein
MTGMKLRHAAALALIGWYLMAPPIYTPAYRVDLSAPISAWDIIGSFNTASDCTDILIKLKKQRLGNPHSKKQKALHRRTDNSRCIATDDPRLKKNRTPSLQNRH